MALVICPECGSDVSQSADVCQKCGFPIKKFLEENELTDFTKALVCPKCAETHENEFIPPCLKCKYCATTMVQTDLDIKEFFRFGCNCSDEEFNAKAIELAKQYGNDQFDEKAFEERIVKRNKRNAEFMNNISSKNVEKNIPKCPKCGSTNFTPVRKKFSLLTGFATNKVELVCNNCGTRINPK